MSGYGSVCIARACISQLDESRTIVFDWNACFSMMHKRMKYWLDLTYLTKLIEKNTQKFPYSLCLSCRPIHLVSEYYMNYVCSYLFRAWAWFSMDRSLECNCFWWIWVEYVDIWRAYDKINCWMHAILQSNRKVAACYASIYSISNVSYEANSIWFWPR